jgi:hypothetical protein
MHKNIQKLVLCIVVIVLLQVLSCKKNIEEERSPEPEPPELKTPLTMNNVVGVDQFGRSFGAVSSLKTNKQVGLFFWLWIGQPYANGIYDATSILAMPNGLKLLTDVASHNEAISPNGQAHFWGEPIWGYYNSDDVWVLRKQVEMLTIAGVDFIFFDATNAFIYKHVFDRLLKIIHEYQEKGWSPPKVVFYTHSRSFQTIRELYRDLYKPGLYSDTWYKVDGKPMIIGYTNPQDDLNEAKSRGDNTYAPGILSDEILSFFHFKRPQWPSDPVYPDGFPWVEWIFPQPMHNGVMNVTVASHPSVPMSFSLTKGLVNWGRGWDPDTKTNVSENVDKGTFFQRQWDHALQSNPDMITIGGWNEWIAYKQPYWDEYVLVDAVNKEYSRDIEPMKGGYEDAFYIQMIQNIRRYKGVEASNETVRKKTINIGAGAAQWNDVPAIGVNIHTKAFGRDAYGAATAIRYSQASPSNHITDVKVTHDDKNIYFFIRCRDQFSANSGRSNWLNILIGTGEPRLKNWESYEYLIGETFTGDNVSVGKLNSDFKTTNTGNARFIQNENVIQIECAREMLGLNNNNKFYFKVAAGVEEPSDIMSYYASGVSLPIGRLSYLYQMEK